MLDLQVEQDSVSVVLLAGGVGKRMGVRDACHVPWCQVQQVLTMSSDLMGLTGCAPTGRHPEAVSATVRATDRSTQLPYLLFHARGKRDNYCLWTRLEVWFDTHLPVTSRDTDTC